MDFLEIALFCRNEAPRVRGALQRLQEQSSPALPIRAVVLENGSTDDTAEAAIRAGDDLTIPGQFEVSVHAELPAGKARSWNYFVSQAAGEILGFMDADVAPALGSIATLFEALRRDDDLDLAGGVNALHPDFLPGTFWQSVFAVPYRGIKVQTGIIGTLYLARRSRLEPVGMDAMNEDLLLTLRHEGRYVVCHDAPVYFVPPTSFGEFVRQRARIRRADALERKRAGVDLAPHRRKSLDHLAAYYRIGGPIRLLAYLGATSLGKAASLLPKDQAGGWVTEAGRS